MELVDQNDATQYGEDNYERDVFGTTKNETMFTSVLSNGDEQIAQIGRVYFKENDLYAVTFVAGDADDVPKKVKMDLTRILKKVK